MPTINVKTDYGAVGNGLADDTAHIQNAFDAAFGTSSNPHGTNTALNSDVYFPPGLYLTFGNTLTQVKNGRIYGDGISGPTLKANTNNISVIGVNGMENTSIENLGWAGTNPDLGNVTGFDLNWNGSGSVGLSGNTFSNCGGFNCTHWMRIGRSGFGGANNTLKYCNTSTCNRAVRIESAAATGQIFLGGGYASGTGDSAIWVERGNIAKMLGVQLARTENGPDIIIDGGGTTVIRGGRSESKSYCKVSNGRVTISGIKHGGFRPIGAPQQGVFLELAGAAAFVQVDSCSINTEDLLHGIIGTSGNLWCRNFVTTKANGDLNNVGTAFDSFSATLHFLRAINSTVANLPINPKTNMEAIVIDGSGTPALGATVVGGGSSQFVVRYNYNGSGAWSVVGK